MVSDGRGKGRAKPHSMSVEQQALGEVSSEAGMFMQIALMEKLQVFGNV